MQWLCLLLLRRLRLRCVPKLLLLLRRLRWLLLRWDSPLRLLLQLLQLLQREGWRAAKALLQTGGTGKTRPPHWRHREPRCCSSRRRCCCADRRH